MINNLSNVDKISDALEKSYFSDYYATIREITHVPDHAISCLMRMQLAMMLPNAYYETSQGSVRTSIGHIWLASSGMNKTGVKNLLRDTFKKLYPSPWYLFSKANWQYITKTLNELSPNEKQSGLPFNMAVIRDEVSTLAKDMKSGALGTSLEFYSDLMDNQLQEYGTIRGGGETYPSVVYSPIWFTGTKIFLNHLADEYWEQGIGFRFLYVKDEPMVKYRPINGKKWSEEVESLLQNIRTNYFPILQRVSQITATEDFVNQYNEYVDEIQTKIQLAQQNHNETPEIDAIKKHQKIILQLSIIHAASRVRYSHNYRELQKLENQVNNEFMLSMDKQDLENAMKDLEMYKKTYIEYYHEYLNRKAFTLTATTYKRLRLEFINSMAKLKNTTKQYRLDFSEGEEVPKLTSDRFNGEWYVRSDITRPLGWDKATAQRVVENLEADRVVETQQAKHGKSYGIVIRLIVDNGELTN